MLHNLWALHFMIWELDYADDIRMLMKSTRVLLLWCYARHYPEAPAWRAIYMDFWCYAEYISEADFPFFCSPGTFRLYTIMICTLLATLARCFISPRTGDNLSQLLLHSIDYKCSLYAFSPLIFMAYLFIYLLSHDDAHNFIMRSRYGFMIFLFKYASYG